MRCIVRPLHLPPFAKRSRGNFSHSLQVLVVRIPAPKRALRLKAKEDETGEDEIIAKEDEDRLLKGLRKFVAGEDDKSGKNDDLDIRLGDFLDPSLDNVLALLLTGLLGLAVLQITWQLLLVAAAIVISGLKYTVLAAFLIAFVIFFL